MTEIRLGDDIYWRTTHRGREHWSGRTVTDGEFWFDDSETTVQPWRNLARALDLIADVSVRENKTALLTDSELAEAVRIWRKVQACRPSAERRRVLAPDGKWLWDAAPLLAWLKDGAE